MAWDCLSWRMRNLQSSQRPGSLILGKTGLDNCDPRRPGAALGRETAEHFAQRSVLCSVSPDSWALLVRELVALNNDNSLSIAAVTWSSVWEHVNCSCGRGRKSTSKGPSRSAEWAIGLVEHDRIAAGGADEALMTGGR